MSKKTYPTNANKELVSTEINWGKVAAKPCEDSMFEVPRAMTPEELRDQFDEDTKIVADQAVKFVNEIYPAYLISSKEQLLNEVCDNSNVILNAFKFYKIKSCLIGKTENIQEELNQKINKFFAAMHGYNLPIAYGVTAQAGKQNLVIGIYDKENNVALQQILEGLIDGAELQEIKLDLPEKDTNNRKMGIVSAIPSARIDEERQFLELSPLMRSLNGHNYSVLFISRPVPDEIVANKYGSLISMRDECFAVSKRNLSRQSGFSRSEGATNSHSETHGTTKTNGINYGFSFILTVTGNHSKATSDTVSDSIGKSVSESINKNAGISSEMQNGYALELMEYLDKAIDRYRIGRNNGMWETAVTYSSPEENISDMIKSHIMGELSKPDPDMLPPICNQFAFQDNNDASGSSIMIPKFVTNKTNEYKNSKIATLISSEELASLCNLPCLSVPNFEIKKGIIYPVQDSEGEVAIGKVCIGNSPTDHMEFNLSHNDLTKHTFVCGITGSGKTTTVKGILSRANVPFCVIESAKKEYRNIDLGENKHPTIYTLGKPEINCPRINPFYIQRGVSPQTHIDFLKDLFTASFSFYGPMPYILEKCLYRIYEKRGWNLTLGYHPYLINSKDETNFYDSEYADEKYTFDSHKYLFPTMNDLKKEILRYIEQEMDYEGELAGNIKTAITARLEGLCTGAKGYMFNTNEYLKMDELLQSKTVLELEGLSDDSDKAFCVGLLVIFVTEYRQISNEVENSKESLNHLLVIEEAHRLLKNVDTDRSTENTGNPKGKAVEHFTNMIAEMRAYGQGVIIAEQIPTKLAPDVIKNSSNKIVQRLVAADDQKVIANTMCMPENEAIYIGNILPHYALCHKEGMSLPVSVLVEPSKDVRVTDSELYEGSDKENKFLSYNSETIKASICDLLPEYAFKILNALLIKEYNDIATDVKIMREKFEGIIKLKGIHTMFCNDNTQKEIYATLLTKEIVKLLCNGAYKTQDIASNDLIAKIKDVLNAATDEKVSCVKQELKKAYNDDPKTIGILRISRLILRQMNDNMDVVESIKEYFVEASDSLVAEMKNQIIKEGRNLSGNTFS